MESENLSQCLAVTVCDADDRDWTKADIPELVKSLNDTDADGRASAARALGEIGPGAKEAVPALIKALDDQDGNVRRTAVDSLGAIGPDAKEAVPALISALLDPDPEVRARSAGAVCTCLRNRF